MKSIFVLFLYLCTFVRVHAANDDSTASFQPLPADSATLIRPANGLSPAAQRIVSSRTYRITSAGVPLILGGIVIQNINTHFKTLRDDYIPGFHHHYDDYLQYAPAAVMLGLKAAGVKSRSSWGRMLVSDAFAAAIMAVAVNSVKYGVKELRPDGSANNSFPSGHTATAFMTATMLSKEYGEQSIWYSIGAYTTATAIGVSRVANNKHWMGDVLVGAGIGILSTEIGYWLADLIFKDKGMTHFGTEEIFDPMRRPSFLGVYMGFSMAPGSYRMPDGSQMILGTGYAAGVEGAWFMSPYIGFGGRLAASTMPVFMNGTLINNQNLKHLILSGGAYFSYPLLPMLNISSKLVVSYIHYEPGQPQTETLRIRGKDGFGMGTGLALNFRARQNFGFRLFLDYDLNTSLLEGNRQIFHMLTSGIATNVLF